MQQYLNHYKSFISFLAGGLLVLAFAPFAFRIFAFISPALLLWCLIDANHKAAFLRGFLFGCGLFSAGTYWIYISIHTFGEAPMIISFIITLLFITALSLFVAATTYLFSLFKTPLSFQCLAVFPAIWVIGEWARSWILTGFPWLFLGYSQVDTSFKTYAPIIGVYGLSFLVSLSAGALVLLLKAPRKQKYLALLSLSLIWSLSKALIYHAPLQAEAKLYSVSLIAGNIPQSLKWNAEQAEKTLETYYKLTQIQGKHRLIIWPEGAIPIFKSQADFYLHDLNKLLKQKDQIVITGIPMGKYPKFYNGILMLGQAQGEYHKIHLVPFGEYYPLKWLVSPLFDYLKIPMSDLTSGSPNQALLNANGLRIAPFVCYEITYPQQVLRQIRDAGLLVTLSDDSWFDHSIAAAQHLEIAQLRALETQRFLLFSTNGGISAVINPQGQLLAKIPADQQGIIHAQIRAVTGSTLLMQWGYTPLGILIVVLLVIAFKIRTQRVRLF